MRGRLFNGSAAFGLAAAGLLVANSWLAWTFWSRWDQARLADTQLAHLERVAQRIEQLRRSPVRIEEGPRTNEALARLVENAARQVSLNPEQIVRIDPAEARTLEKSPYLEQKTNVELREVTLQKIVELSIALEASGKGFSLPALSIRVPAGADSPTTDELWNAQLLLTCRIYEGNVSSLSSRSVAPKPSN